MGLLRSWYKIQLFDEAGIVWGCQLTNFVELLWCVYVLYIPCKSKVPLKEWSSGYPKRNLLYLSGAKYSLWTPRIYFGLPTNVGHPEPSIKAFDNLTTTSGMKGLKTCRSKVLSEFHSFQFQFWWGCQGWENHPASHSSRTIIAPRQLFSSWQWSPMFRYCLMYPWKTVLLCYF